MQGPRGTEWIGTAPVGLSGRSGKDCPRGGGAFRGTITGVSRIKQKQPKYVVLKQRLAGIALSMVALEIAAMGNQRLALTHLESVFRSIRRDKAFVERARERAAKYACMNER